MLKKLSPSDKISLSVSIGVVILAALPLTGIIAMFFAVRELNL